MEVNVAYKSSTRSGPHDGRGKIRLESCDCDGNLLPLFCFEARLLFIAWMKFRNKDIRSGWPQCSLPHPGSP